MLCSLLRVQSPTEEVHTTCSTSQDLSTLAGGGVAGALGEGLAGSGEAGPAAAAKGTSIKYTFFSQASTKLADGLRLPHTQKH